MDLYERAKYGMRHSFVLLRYIATVFLALSLFGNFLLVYHYVDAAVGFLPILQSGTLTEIAGGVFSFSLGESGTFINFLRSLGSISYPLYFLGVVSFIFHLDRSRINGETVRTAIMAIVFYFVETLLIVFALLIATLLLGILFFTFKERLPELIPAIDIPALIDGILGNFHIEYHGTVLDSFETLWSTLEYEADNRLLNYMWVNMPSVNTFLDLLLCLFMTIFLVERPKFANTKGKLIAFRCMALLPIGYLVAAFVLHGLMRQNLIFPDVGVLALFPAKSLLHFVFFGCILFAFRLHPLPKLSVWEGLIPLEHKSKYFTTGVVEAPSLARRRALHTAVTLGAALLILSGIDLCFSFLPFAAKWGLGRSYYAAFAVPFLFFFDARRPVAKRTYRIFSVFYALVLFSMAALYALALGVGL